MSGHHNGHCGGSHQQRSEHGGCCSHGHSHGHGHSHIPSSGNEKVIFLGFLLTFGFMIIEAVGGWISGSLALIADAGHMLTDASALALAWAAFYFGRKQISAKKTFGYHRFEVLAAFINALALFLITFWISYEAVLRIQNPHEILAGPMLIVAVIGLLVNCLVFYILTRGDKEHLNIKAAILHVLGDLLGSVGAIVAAIVIYFTGWTLIDPILSILVCLLILKNAWGVLQNSLNILMEGVPIEINLDDFKQEVETISNVAEVGHIHIWAITSGKTMATLNVSLKEEKNIFETIEAVKEHLHHKFNIEHSTIEVGMCQCPLKKKKEHKHGVH